MASLIFLSGLSHGTLQGYFIIAIPYFTDASILTLEEMSWCGENLPLEGRVVFGTNNQPILQLASCILFVFLAQCSVAGLRTE